MGSYVGIDLPRRRSVIVVLNDDGDRVSWSRIDNTPANLAGEVPELREMVRYRAKLSRLRSGSKAQVHQTLGKEGVIPELDSIWRGGGRSGWTICGWVTCTSIGSSRCVI
jgi:hypothetical protein